MLNQYSLNAKKEKKIKKQKAKKDDKMPAAMMNKIEEMVRQRVESELERERSVMSARNMDNSQSVNISSIQNQVDQSTMSLNDSSSVEMTAAYRENLPKMAVLVSKDFMDVEGIEGREIAIEFTVENQSNMAWPFKPFV